MSDLPRNISAFGLPAPTFSTCIRSTQAPPYLAVVDAESLSGQVWARMKATGRPILTPARNILLNLSIQARAESLGRRPTCRRCLHVLRHNHGYSDNISRLSAARIRRGAVVSCNFWHEETKRRSSAALQARSLATVREGTIIQIPRHE